MGKFDGYLICSDIDGTIEDGREYEKYTQNYDAVKYFTEGGGRFTFTTGRYLFYLRNERFAKVINAPACIFNGGIIYDYQNEKLLFEKHLPHTNRQIIEFIEPFKKDIIRYDICCDTEADYDKYKGYDLPDFVLENKPIKNVFVFETPQKANEFQSTMRKLPELSDYYICKSWDVSVEFLHKDATKGQALKFIKEYLGDIHTAIGIGDNENDLTMIQSADIGVAVGDACESVKQAADMTVVSCREFAIKDLIKKIENNLI